MKNKIVKITKRQYWCDDEYYGAWFKCPACEQEEIKQYDNFCSNCGVELQWTKSAMGQYV